MAESLDTCQGKLLTCGTSPRESSVLQSTEVVGNPKSAWTLEFTLLAFVLVVVRYFFTKRPFLLFGMVSIKCTIYLRSMKYAFLIFMLGVVKAEHEPYCNFLSLARVWRPVCGHGFR